MFFLVKFDPLMWPYPTPQDFDLNKFETTLSKVAFTKVSGFLGKWFFEEDCFIKMSPKYSYSNPPST